MKYLLLPFLIIISSCTLFSQVKEPDLYNYDIEEKIEELGITINQPGKPVANYVNTVRAGKLVFISGKGPKKADQTYVTGKVPSETSMEEGYEAARLTAIELIAALKAEIGDLNKVEQIVEVLGMVNADPDFTDHPKVINGCSDLLVEIFGDRGRHTRAAVGMGSLPSNISCEIKMTVLVRD